LVEVAVKSFLEWPFFVFGNSGLKTRKSLTPMTDALVEFVHEFSALDSGGSTSGNNSLGRAGEIIDRI
jgi:hypothetical protein